MVTPTAYNFCRSSRCTVAGHTIPTLQSLANGVPVVTLPAKFVRGRFALAMYLQMGYTDLVADDIQVNDNTLRGNPIQLAICDKDPSIRTAWFHAAMLGARGGRGYHKPSVFSPGFGSPLPPRPFGEDAPKIGFLSEG